MRRNACIALICFVLMTVFSGCGVMQKLGLVNSSGNGAHPASSIAMNEEEAKKLTDKYPVRLYFANGDNTKLRLQIRYISVSEAKKSVNNLATIIVRELIKGPDAKSGLNPVIPEGTQLLSTVSISETTAVVNLSRDFIEKHPGGKTAEQLTIYSIVNSLTELKEIQKVKFLINGNVQKDFKGSFRFDNPFPRAASLISRETVQPSPKTDTDTKKIIENQDSGGVSSSQGTDGGEGGEGAVEILE